VKEYKKLILDEENNTIVGKNLYPSSYGGVSSQVRKFDDSYNPEKVRNLFQEYDNATVADTDFKKLTLVKTNAVQEIAVQFKTKLFIVSAISVVALLAFLVIYNFFVINSMSYGITILREGVKMEQNTLNEIISEYDSLPSEEAFKEKLRAEGYLENAGNAVYLSLPETTKYVELEGETNFFNKLCNFISSLINGG